MDFNSSFTDGKPTADPFAPDGEPNGTTPAAIQAALTGEPGTLPATWCKQCAAEVLPIGKGRCPRCNSFLKLNFAARKHPVNKLRRQQLLDMFVLDYRPTTQRLQSMCEQYAGIVEQLEVLKPGSPDHQRLVQLSQLLGAALEESQSSRETRTPSNMRGIDQMPSSALHLAMDLLNRQVAGETLTDRELGQLDVLMAASHGTVLLPPDPDPLDALTPPVSTLAAGDTKQEAHGTAAPDSKAAKPEPSCAYGCGTLARCAERKEQALDVWRTLHFLDAEEVARRDEEATRTMFKTMAHGSGVTTW